MKKKHIILITVIVCILVVGARYTKRYMEIREYRSIINAISIQGIDLSKVPDGLYEGYSDGMWVSAYVWVSVKNHKIVDIQLQHYHDRGETAEVLIDKVLEAQSTNIDFVTGATSSSKVILKAIENAILPQ